MTKRELCKFIKDGSVPRCIGSSWLAVYGTFHLVPTSKAPNRGIYHLCTNDKEQMYRPEAKFPEMLQSGSANGLVMCLCFKNQCHCRVCGCDPWTRATDIWMPCNTIVFDHLHALSDKAITKHGQKEENLVDIIPRGRQLRKIFLNSHA